MKKLTILMVVAFFVGLVLYIVGAALTGVEPSGSFDIHGLATAFITIGIITFILAGVFLMGLGIVAVVRSISDEQQKK